MSVSTSVITINAPVQRVWDALTKPELVKQWQFGSDLITDWSIGEKIVFHSEWEGAVYEQWGKVLEFDPCHSLSYTLFAPRPGLEDAPENYFKMTYLLTQEDEGVVVTIEQNDTRPGIEVDSGSDDDGQAILDALKGLVESLD